MRKIFTPLFIIISITVLFAQNTVLPNYSTDQEKAQLQFYTPPKSTAVQSPPPGTGLRTAAEWEEMRGTVISWQGYNNFLSEIVKYAKEEGFVYIFTNDSNSVKNTLQSNGITSDNTIKYLDQNTNSVWIRDYGPNNVYADSVGDLVFVDWVYNRSRPADDSSPDYLANYLNIPIYSSTSAPTDLVNTGGNFMSDGKGNSFCSKLVMDENEYTSSFNSTPKTEAEVDEIMEDYMGILSYAKMDNLPYDGIHHIDMHIKLLDEQTLLVGEYPSGVADGPQIEQNIQYILDNYQTCFGTDYKVVRIPMPPETWNGNEYYPDDNGSYLTYTNSLIINKTVLVPIYMNEEYDTTAIRIYHDAMPGYNIVGIDASDPIQASGAIHCTSHEIGIDNPLLIVHQPLEDQFANTTSYTVKANIQHRDGITSAKVYYSINNNTNYQTVDMIQTTGNFWTANIPQQVAGTYIYYYVEGTATTGKQQVRPMPAPEGYWKFKILVTTESVNTIAEDLNIKYYNKDGNLNIYFTSQDSKDIQIELYNQLGANLGTIVNSRTYHGVNQYAISTSNYASGIYFIKVKYGNNYYSEKVLIK